MKHDEFIGQVQHRADLDSRRAAEEATRVVLETIGERLAGGEPSDLGSQLPQEIGIHLHRIEKAKQGSGRFDPHGFVRRVVDRSGVSIDDQTAVHWTHAVLDVTRDAVSEGQWDEVIGQLPYGYVTTFDLSRN